MNRKVALDLFADCKIKEIDDQEYEELLLDFWSLDEEDEEFHLLPDNLKYELLHNEFPEIINRDKYKPLAKLSIIYSLKGVKNEYLFSALKKWLNIDEEILGELENMYECPCCGLFTLNAQNDHEICRACKWEDDGIREVNKYSNCNRSTLKDARIKFKSMPSIEKQELLFKYKHEI